MEISKKLENMRLALGYTQEELAEMLGVSQPTINRTENENDDNIKIGRIKSYCQLAGISLQDFLCSNCIEVKVRPDIKELAEVVSKLTPEQVTKLTQFIQGIINNSD